MQCGLSVSEPWGSVHRINLATDLDSPVAKCILSLGVDPLERRIKTSNSQVRAMSGIVGGNHQQVILNISEMVLLSGGITENLLVS